MLRPSRLHHKISAQQVNGKMAGTDMSFPGDLSSFPSETPVDHSLQSPKRSPSSSPRSFNLPDRDPVRNLGKNDVVTPDDVLYVAHLLGVNPDAEPQLLWIAKEALETPLPPTWKYGWNAGEGRNLYQNTFTNEFSSKHPGDKRALNLIQQQRITTSAGNFALDGAWMEFYDLDGQRYFYSFSDAIMRSSAPAASMPIERPEGLIQYEDDVEDEGMEVSEDPSRSLVMMKNGGPELDVLEFKSWWSEASLGVEKGSMKRYVELRFDIPTGNFQVLLDRSDKMYTLSHIQGLHGPLQCWDLYVGARVNILGRSTTLMQASGATLEWLEAHGGRLRKIKERLETEIMKYDRKMSKMFIGNVKVKKVTNGQEMGTSSLRRLMQEIEKRRIGLSKYRPKLADQICGLASVKKKRK